MVFTITLYITSEAGKLRLLLCIIPSRYSGASVNVSLPLLSFFLSTEEADNLKSYSLKTLQESSDSYEKLQNNLRTISVSLFSLWHLHPSISLQTEKRNKGTMAAERYQEAVSGSDLHGEDNSSPGKWKTISETVVPSDERAASGFDCNICLDSLQDPVVTFCGHLYCWPCIYKWLHFQGTSTENQHERRRQQCPVCKAEVSEATLIPLFGRGQSTKPSKIKAPSRDIVIPQRPLACRLDLSRSPLAASSPRPTHQIHHHNYAYQSHLYHPRPESHSSSAMLQPNAVRPSINNPTIGMIGEMIYATVFGNPVTNAYAHSNSYHLAGTGSPRMRRHVMMADKSLSKISFFLFCCAFFCLLLF